jgi:hypothetical protein
MVLNLACGLAITITLLYLSATELTYINGTVAAVVLSSSAVAALLVSAMKAKGGIVSRNEGQESIELKGAGLEAKLTGRRLLGENTLLFILGCALAYSFYTHHTSNEEALKRVYEATVENTYVLSLSQAEREALKIAMPESLRKKIRREP